MKLAFIIGLFIAPLSFSSMSTKTYNTADFTEKEILKQFDLAFQGIPSEYYPSGEKDDIKYNFFLDLEHGYLSTAGNRIHLYADADR